MADDKRGREKQERDSERRQREREVTAELERGDEPEPPVAIEALSDFESELESIEFPATGTTVVAAIGDREIESATSRYTIEELVPETETETFDSPAAVTVHLLEPTVAAATKRILEASNSLPNTNRSWSQRKAYEMTFQKLNLLDGNDGDDGDNGIQVISDWIIEYIHENERLPGSRDVRRQAAKFCRTNGYQVRNDEWLGI